MKPTYDWGPALPKHRMYVTHVPGWQVHPLGDRESVSDEVRHEKMNWKTRNTFSWYTDNLATVVLSVPQRGKLMFYNLKFVPSLSSASRVFFSVWAFSKPLTPDSYSIALDHNSKNNGDLPQPVDS